MSQAALYVVATPIGNLSDLTFRALETLKACDWIACEDTRRTLKLLTHYGIHKPLLSLFGPKERTHSGKILRLLEQGKSVALLTDAGTPGLSDPGNFLVNSLHQAGFPVFPIPGPNAAAALASVSGVCEDGFIFLGFLSRKRGKIVKELESAARLGLPIVFFESPFRVRDTLEIAISVVGELAHCMIGREMTKKFEEYISGSLAAVLEKISTKDPLGEFTVLIKPTS